MKKYQVLLLVLLVVGCIERDQKTVDKPGSVVWSFATRGEIHSSPAIGADGVIYFGSDDGYLYAIHANGTKKWKYYCGKNIHSSPAIGADGTIYFTGNSQLFALYPEGEEKWSIAFKEGISSTSSPAIGADGSIYVGSNNGLYSINEQGKENWAFRPGYTQFYSPSVGGDGVIYAGCNTGIWSVSPQGQKKWWYDFGADAYESLTINSDSHTYPDYAYSEFGSLYPNGILKWFKGGEYRFPIPPSIDADGTLYMGGGQEGAPALLALKPDDGATLWSRRLEGGVSTTPAIGNDSVIYVASRTGKLFALNQDGATIWELMLGGPILCSSPAISADGTIYLGAEDGKLYAVASSSSGLANSPWPKYRQNNSSSGAASHPEERFITSARATDSSGKLRK